MRAVIQRVSKAELHIRGELISSIGTGFLVLLGVEVGDTDHDRAYMVKKIKGLRVFEDQEEKMNLSLSDVEGEILLVSQFTLLGDTRKGNRPSYIKAARPEEAEAIYHQVKADLEEEFKVATGVFGDDMQISLVNDGPVTILIDSARNF